MAQWQSMQINDVIGRDTHGLQGERDVAVARAVAAEEMRDRIQAEMVQLRLSQEAWEQERRVIARDQDRYRQERNSA